MTKFLKTVALCCTIICLFTSCISQKRATGSYQKAWQKGDYNAAYQAMPTKASASNELYYLLHSGAAQMSMNQAIESNGTFDKAERVINDFEANLLNSTFETGKGFLLGESSKVYRGESYDATMLNVYKALNYLSLGDSEKAIVEWNRAFQRQETAAQMSASEIEKTRRSIKEKERDSLSTPVDYDTALKNINQSAYGSWMNHWEAYPDFVNPVATYLQGLTLFLYGDGSDLENASHLFQRSLSMNEGKTQYILEDYSFVERVLDMKTQRKSLEDTVWVIIENGTAATKIERKYQIPIPFGGRRPELHIVPIALPVMESGNRAFSFFSVKEGGESYQSELISDMDRIIYTEFKSDYPAVLLRAIVNATAKLFFQRKMSKEANGVGMLASMVYTQVTTNADTRTWTSLPRDFQLIKLPKPSDNILELYGENSVKIISIALNQKGHSFVRVKVPSRYAVPSVSLLTPDS